MLKPSLPEPIVELGRFARIHGLPEAEHQRRVDALMAQLRRPHGLTADGRPIVTTHAHGPSAVRVVDSGKQGYEIYVWNHEQDQWCRRDVEGLSRDAVLLVAERYGDVGPLTCEAFCRKWEDFFRESQSLEGAAFTSRDGLLAYWYDGKTRHADEAHGWPEDGTCQHWSSFSSRNHERWIRDCADLAFRYQGVPPIEWSQERAERAQEILHVERWCWGEVSTRLPSPNAVVPNYLISIMATGAPIEPNGGVPPTADIIGRRWVSSQDLKHLAKRYGIDRASAPSPSASEYIWWYAAEPIRASTHRVIHQLHVHAVMGEHGEAHEPGAAEYQGIADLVGIAFEQPERAIEMLIRDDSYPGPELAA